MYNFFSKYASENKTNLNCILKNNFLTNEIKPVFRNMNINFLRIAVVGLMSFSEWRCYCQYNFDHWKYSDNQWSVSKRRKLKTEVVPLDKYIYFLLLTTISGFVIICLVTSNIGQKKKKIFFLFCFIPVPSNIFVNWDCWFRVTDLFRMFQMLFFLFIPIKSVN